MSCALLLVAGADPLVALLALDRVRPDRVVQVGGNGAWAPVIRARRAGVRIMGASVAHAADAGYARVVDLVRWLDDPLTVVLADDPRWTGVNLGVARAVGDERRLPPDMWQRNATGQVVSRVQGIVRAHRPVADLTTLVTMQDGRATAVTPPASAHPLVTTIALTAQALVALRGDAPVGDVVPLWHVALAAGWSRLFDVATIVGDRLHVVVCAAPGMPREALIGRFCAQALDAVRLGGRATRLALVGIGDAIPDSLDLRPVQGVLSAAPPCIVHAPTPSDLGPALAAWVHDG